MNFRRESTVHAEELLVHEGRQRQTVERVHASVVHPLRVFYFTWKQRETTRQHDSRVVETTTRYALDCLNVLSTPSPSFFFFLSFLQTCPPRFVRRTLFVLGEQQWIGKKRKGERGGWVKFVFWDWLAVVSNIIMNGMFEKMLVQRECVPCQPVFFIFF